MTSLSPETGTSLSGRKIIHVDMDAFYASVEQRDDPDLRNRPVIVGGRPNGRGVVAACSYEARKFGIHSAMPSAVAGRLCPHAQFVKPRFAAYQAVSRQIQQIFREYTPLVEPLSLDEAYLDVSGSLLFDGSALLLARDIKTRIFEQTGLVASAGVSYNKFLAKVASDHDKPDGLYCIRPEQGENFVAALPVGRFHGVGKVTQARMHELGIETGADLRAWTLEELRREFGKSADYFYRAARAEDSRPVRNSRTRKSMGSERTFSQNLNERADMLAVLIQLAEELLQSLESKRLCAASITIKVRFGDFATFTRAYTPDASLINSRIARRAMPFMLDRVLDLRAAQSAGQSTAQNDAASALPERKLGVRLLGVSFSALTGFDAELPEQLDMDL